MTKTADAFSQRTRHTWLPATSWPRLGRFAASTSRNSWTTFSKVFGKTTTHDTTTSSRRAMLRSSSMTSSPQAAPKPNRTMTHPSKPRKLATTSEWINESDWKIEITPKLFMNKIKKCPEVEFSSPQIKAKNDKNQLNKSYSTLFKKNSLVIVIQKTKMNLLVKCQLKIVRSIAPFYFSLEFTLFYIELRIYSFI